jgi:hypothetical protein
MELCQPGRGPCRFIFSECECSDQCLERRAERLGGKARITHRLVSSLAPTLSHRECGRWARCTRRQCPRTGEESPIVCHGACTLRPVFPVNISDSPPTRLLSCSGATGFFIAVKSCHISFSIPTDNATTSLAALSRSTRKAYNSKTSRAVT